MRCLSDRRTLSQIHICSFGIFSLVFREHYSTFKADLMQVLWKYPPNVSPVGFLIRSTHAVAHTLGPLYLLLNHLITLSSISLHNWMKRRNRSVTLECLRDLYFLLNICVQCSGERETPALVLIELRLDSQQNKGRQEDREQRCTRF